MTAFGRKENLMDHQYDVAQIQQAIEILSNPQILAGLSGACDGFDTYLNLIGADDVAVILRDSLQIIFQRDLDIFARAHQVLETLPDNTADNWPDAGRQAIASLLTEIIKKNELWKEVGAVISKALWIGMARTRRAGESNFFTRLEDQSHEELLMREYSGVETEIFNKLKHRLHARERSPALGVTDGSSISSLEGKIHTETDRAKSKMHDFGRLGKDVDSKMLSFSEMQARISSWELSSLGDDWKKEPLKTFLWLLQNGTQEQLLAYIYKNADKIPDEMRKKLLEGLAADEHGEIPIVWKTILIRALSRANSV